MSVLMRAIFTAASESDGDDDLHHIWADDQMHVASGKWEVACAILLCTSLTTSFFFYFPRYDCILPPLPPANTSSAPT